MSAAINPDEEPLLLEQSSNRIQGWLDKCEKGHLEFPCAFRNTSTKPSRLICLVPDSQTSKLVNVNKLVDVKDYVPRYLILSYVWGPEEDNYLTKKKNLAQLYKEIPLDLLPLTVRQFFQLARTLKFEYVWVDALCIVQDSTNDKKKEIGNMATTYYNATLQISAVASLGASHGLLPPEWPKWGYDAKNGLSPSEWDVKRQEEWNAEKDDHHKIMSACRSLEQDIWDGRLRDFYRLLTRGWAFQERILSRRCVHFTRFELMWECKHARECECGWKRPESSGSGIGNLINNFSAAFDEVCYDPTRNQAGLEKLIPLWRECVMSYSKRDLSEPDDRLVAIEGIARMLRGPEFNTLYLSGLWIDAMPFDLLWRSDQTSELVSAKTRKTLRWSWPTVKSRKRPSWSWSSFKSRKRLSWSWSSLKKKKRLRCSWFPGKPSKRPSWSWSSGNRGVDWPTVSPVVTEKEKEKKSEAAQSVSKISPQEESEMTPEEKSLAYMTSATNFERRGVTEGPLMAEVHFITTPNPGHEYPLEIVLKEAPTAPFRIRKNKNEKDWEAHKTKWVVEGSPGQALLPFYPDSRPVSFTTDPVYPVGYLFVQIACLQKDKGIWEAGLIVRKHKIIPGRYERIGMAGFPVCEPKEEISPWWPKHSQCKDIRLI
jgi:hypothetical protein